MKVTKEKGESLEVTEGATGEFYTFGALVIKYGGWQWPAAIQGAKNTAVQCSLLGGRWVKQDQWSKLMMYFVTTEKYSDMFNKKWSLLEQRLNETRPDSEAQPSTAAVSAPATGEKKDDQPKRGEKKDAQQKQGAKGKANAKNKSKANVAAKGTNDKAINEANRLKTKLIKVQAEATNLIARVKSGAAAYHAVNHVNAYGALEQSLKKLEDAFTEFDQDYLVKDIKTIKMAMSEGEFMSGIEQFARLESYVTDISFETWSLLRRLTSPAKPKAPLPKKK